MEETYTEIFLTAGTVLKFSALNIFEIDNGLKRQ